MLMGSVNDRAISITFAVFNNLLNRNGFNNLWDEIDTETREEIINEIQDIITLGMRNTFYMGIER